MVIFMAKETSEKLKDVVKSVIIRTVGADYDIFRDRELLELSKEFNEGYPEQLASHIDMLRLYCNGEIPEQEMAGHTKRYVNYILDSYVSDRERCGENIEKEKLRVIRALRDATDEDYAEALRKLKPDIQEIFAGNIPGESKKQFLRDSITNTIKSAIFTIGFEGIDHTSALQYTNTIQSYAEGLLSPEETTPFVRAGIEYLYGISGRRPELGPAMQKLHEAQHIYKKITDEDIIAVLEEMTPEIQEFMKVL